MAKNKKTNNKRASGPRNRRKALSYAAQDRVGSHVRMVMDPCNAPLGHTAYRGSDGFVTRTKSVSTSSVTGALPFTIFAYYPAYNRVWTQLINNAATALTPDFTTPGPGEAYFLNNAESMRPIGACIQTQYIGSELNRSGTIYRGLLPVSALKGASINSLKALCQKMERLPDSTVETRWLPAPADEEYWEVGTVTPEASGDRFCIVHILSLGTDATTLTTNVTCHLIAEWRPKFGLGIQTPEPTTPDSIGGLERVRTTLARFGKFYLEASDTAVGAMRVGAAVKAATTRVAGVARAVGLLTL